MKRLSLLACLAAAILCGCSDGGTGFSGELSRTDRDYSLQISRIIVAMSDSTAIDSLFSSEAAPDDDLEQWIDELPDDPEYLRALVDTIIQNVKRLQSQDKPVKG
jgi:hypothetical protein